MPRVPRNEWPSDNFEPDDVAPGARFGGELGRALERAGKVARSVTRVRDYDEDDVEDDVDCYDCLASTCQCHSQPVEATALQELDEAVRPTTMALALARAGVVDDTVE